MRRKSLDLPDVLLFVSFTYDVRTGQVWAIRSPKQCDEIDITNEDYAPNWSGYYNTKAAFRDKLSCILSASIYKSNKRLLKETPAHPLHSYVVIEPLVALVLARLCRSCMQARTMTASHSASRSTQFHFIIRAYCCCCCCSTKLPECPANRGVESWKRFRIHRRQRLHCGD